MKSVLANIGRLVGRFRIDIGSLLVLPAGIAIVLLAQRIEGGAARSLLQGPAALIVFGGTLAAVLISFSPIEVLRALREAARTFKGVDQDTTALTASLVSYALRAHRKGVLTLEPDLEDIKDPFLRHGLGLVVDGVPIEDLKEMLALEHSARQTFDDAPARVFDAAAGYAPTLGILGAVLGLIHVMERLAQPGSLGAGIAVAFVATIYGVGSANLLFLPIAGRLRERALAGVRRRELISEALVCIHQRVSPRLIAQRLRAFSNDAPRLDEIAARLSSGQPAASRIPA
jgi:chemotaxis protein MotA